MSDSSPGPPGGESSPHGGGSVDPLVSTGDAHITVGSDLVVEGGDSSLTPASGFADPGKGESLSS